MSRNKITWGSHHFEHAYYVLSLKKSDNIAGSQIFLYCPHFSKAYIGRETRWPKVDSYDQKLEPRDNNSCCHECCINDIFLSTYYNIIIGQCELCLYTLFQPTIFLNWSFLMGQLFLSGNITNLNFKIQSESEASMNTLNRIISLILM